MRYILTLLFCTAVLSACTVKPTLEAYTASLKWVTIAPASATRSFATSPDAAPRTSALTGTGLDSLLVYQRGHIVTRDLADAETMMRARNVRSVTKAIVAATAAQLDAGGHLDLDRPLTAIGGCPVPTALRPLTLRALLDMNTKLSWREDDLTPFTGTNWTCAILGDPAPRAAPAYLYAGASTQLAGAVIEDGMGNRLPAIVQDTLFAPLDLGITAWSRRKFGPFTADTGAAITPADMLAFGVLILEGGTYNGTRILPDTHIKALETSGVTTPSGRIYSAGWRRWRHNGVTILTASGFSGHTIAVVPEKQAVIVISGMSTFTTPQAATARGRTATRLLFKTLTKL